MEYSSHSCKAWAPSVGAKRGVHRDTRRVWGYHAAGRQESVDLYARDTWSAPMRFLGLICMEVARGDFRPDANHSDRYREGYSPFNTETATDVLPGTDVQPACLSASMRKNCGVAYGQAKGQRRTSKTSGYCLACRPPPGTIIHPISQTAIQ